MKNRNDGQIIFLKDLVFAALYQWKKALVLLVAFALILGGVKGVSSFLNMKNAVLQSENTEQQELQMEVYETKKLSLEQQIKTNRENARQQQAYLSESVLMSLDPYNYYELYYSFFVDSGYQIMPDKLYQDPDMTLAIMHAYNEAISSEACVQAIADLMQTKTFYVSEIVSSTALEGSRSFVITAKTPDMESANALLTFLQQYVEQTKTHVSQIVAAHEIRMSESFVSKRMDSALADYQQQQMDKLTTLNNTLTGLQTEKNALAIPEKLVADAGSVVKDAITFAVVGAILGVFLTVLGAWVVHVASGKVYSARTLISYTGIKVLDCINTDAKRDSIEKWLRTKEGRNMHAAAVQHARIAANIRNLLADKSSLLVTASTEDAQSASLITALTQALPGYTVVFKGDPLQDAAVLEEMAKADAVLMIEKCGCSRYTHVQQQMELIEDYGKQLIGCVLLDG